MNKVFASNAVRSIKLGATTIAAIAALGGVAMAQAGVGHFNFYGVEYMPRDQREVAAQAFVSENVKAGMPVSDALRVLRKAGTDCRVPRASGEVISCTHGSFRRRPGEGLVDVTWTVRVTPATDGTVAATTVSRDTAGF